MRALALRIAIAVVAAGAPAAPGGPAPRASGASGRTRPGCRSTAPPGRWVISVGWRRTFRLINIDADPTAGNFTRADIATLRAGGRNTVLSYLNVGACERYRSYWRAAPSGLIPCGANQAAQIAAYHRYPKEVWMNPGNADYRRLIIEHVAARLAATGVDGFFIDNLEIVEHGAHDGEAPCDTTCARGDSRSWRSCAKGSRILCW